MERVGVRRLCALCGAPAQVTVHVRGPRHPAATVCALCHQRLAMNLASLGWCEPGLHYGPPSAVCRRHHVRFVWLGPD
ncbi:hypothetical protein [Pseudonocardia dioxanivorans]|uniref:hypothetical protein n=1 Tax=Pseudonocardia dioxanivorans TaxID=240495 RepID=UPI00104BE576|nr:hypothetical protein [Pseudonocardia dioxanivorans]